MDKKFDGFTLAESDNSTPMGRVSEGREGIKAFTLAEVLITLGVIGVVAAMTLPSVIKHYQQQATVSKIKKFYTTINQAIRQSEAENGSCSTWTRVSYSSNDSQKIFYDTYLSKYIKSTEISLETIPFSKNNTIRTYIIKLPDGSGFGISDNDVHTSRLFYVYFYPNISKLQSTDFTKDRFYFELYNTNCTVKPYTLQWDGTSEQLKNNGSYGCNKTSSIASYCTKLIENNGWQMPKDYPW